MTTLTFHGVRGSCPYDSTENTEFGGNTPCIQLASKDLWLFFDAGTGLLNADKHLLNGKPEHVYMAMSHAHHDHIQGFQLAGSMYTPGTGVRLIGSKETLEGITHAFTQANFPVPFEQHIFKGIDFAHTEPMEDGGGISLPGGAWLRAIKGNHPGGVMGYRVELPDVTLAYATDHEFRYAMENGKPARQDEKDWHYRYQVLVSNADVLIADAQYTELEYTQGSVRGFGHATVEEILGMAAEGNVGHVYVMHHAPKRTDAELRSLEERAIAYANERGYGIDVQYARQGDSFTIGRP